MQIEIQKLKLFLIYFTLSVLVLYFVFAPAIHIPFYHHDIYKYSVGGFHNSCRNDPGFSYLFKLGRPFSAMLDCGGYKVANSLNNVSHLRILCVVLVAFAMSLFAFGLHSVKRFVWPVFFISGAIFVLPAIQTTIIMTATTLVFSILMAFFAWYCLSKSYLFVAKQSASRKDVFYFLGGIGSLFISLFTYPSLSSCFLLPAFVCILFKSLSNWYAMKRTILRDVIIFIISCSLYFIIAKLLQSKLSVVSSNYQFKLNFHFFDRIIFIYKHFPSLWMIHASFLQVALINLIILSGLVIALRNFFLSDFFKYKKNESIRVLLQTLFAVIVLLLLGSLTLLAVPSDDIPIGRVIFVLQAMSILILWWSLIRIGSLFSWKETHSAGLFAGLLFLIGAGVANYNMITSALNDYLEFNYITTTLAKHFQAPAFKLKRIHIISPAAVNFNGLPRGDDILNDNSTHYAGDLTYIVNAAFLQFVGKYQFSLINCIFSEIDEERHFADEIRCMGSMPKNSIAVTYSRPEKPYYKTPDMLIIDMNTLMLHKPTY